LRDFIQALESGDEERAISVTREYYNRIDSNFMVTVDALLTALTPESPQP
jgi:hypothetical protein